MGCLGSSLVEKAFVVGQGVISPLGRGDKSLADAGGGRFLNTG